MKQEQHTNLRRSPFPHPPFIVPDSPIREREVGCYAPLLRQDQGVSLLKRIFGGRVQPGAAARIARSLFETWVEKDQAPPLAQGALPESLWTLYQRKWRLHREATVLMVLLGKEQKDPRYSAVVREYERVDGGSWVLRVFDS